MDYSLVCLVVRVRKQHRPVGGQGFCVDGEAVVLCCDETTFRSLVNAWLVVTAVTIPTQSKKVLHTNCQHFFAMSCTAETPQTWWKLSILPACCNLSTFWNKLVDFIKLQQACLNQARCNLSFADLLQLVETTCSKPVDNKFRQSTCNKSVDILQENCRQQAVTSHVNASRQRFVA